MKFTVSTKEMQDITKKLLKIAPKKSTIPVLEGIMCIVENGSVVLSASDANTMARVTLKTTYAEETGSLVISKDTLNIIAKMKSDTLTITEKEITSGNRTIKFISLDTSLFPEIPNYNYNETAFILNAERFSSIADIRFACSESESTPVLQGICFRNKQAISCDRHRLALRDIPEYNLDRDMIISATTFDHILGLTEKKYAGEYKVTVSNDNKNFAKIEFDNVEMYIRCIDGTYPDVSKIIPNSFVCSININKKEFIEELTLLKEVTDKTNAIKIFIKEGKLLLVAESGDGKNTLESEIKAKITGEFDAIGFNAELLIEGLKYNNNEYVTLNLTGIEKPAMIDSDYLVLPYRNIVKKAA